MLQPHVAAKALSVKLDNSTHARIERLASTRQRTAHWMMRQAIMQYLEREEKRETFRQDTLQAWDEYQATGLYTTSEEVNAWLASWGTDNELSAPVCHQ